MEAPSVPPPSAPIIPEPPSRAPEPEQPAARGGIPTPLAVVIGAALVAAIGLLLLMPGGSKNGSTALSPIAQAAEKTASVSGARFEGSGTGTFEGGSMTMNFNGVYDGAGQRSQMDMTMNVSGPQTLSTSMSAVQDGLVLYMSSPLFAGQLPNGAQWMKLDYSQLGADEADLRSSNSMDGRQVLEQLSEVSGSTQTLGLEKVRGALTTHYQATLDPDKLGAGEISDSTGGAADVWIDHKGLVRRVDMRIWVALPGASPMQVSMSVEYFGFGIDPSITVPAESDSADFTQIGQTALGTAE